MQGERDYSKLRGPTGPLVYPAGFLVVYRALHWLTNGGDVKLGQICFILIYLANQASHMIALPEIGLCCGSVNGFKGVLTKKNKQFHLSKPVWLTRVAIDFQVSRFFPSCAIGKV